MLRRMGPLQGVLKMIPGIGKQLEGLDQVDERQLDAGRGDHPLDDAARAARPARHRRLAPEADRRRQRHDGHQVNQLLEARKQMAKMMKMMGSGKMPQIPGAATTRKPRPSATRKASSKRKKKARR